MHNYMQIVKEELEGLYGESVLADLADILRLYDIYEGLEHRFFSQPERGLDYVPTKKSTNFIKKLIKEQARFLFGKTPEFSLISKEKERAQDLLEFFNRTLTLNSLPDKLIKAARDCFIGKRVAVKLSQGKDGLKVSFVPAYAFVFVAKDNDPEEPACMTFFHQQNNAPLKADQRIWKQKYSLENGKCILNEGIFDGFGRPVEILFKNEDTGLDFIPARVILNDGLSGELTGESDVKELINAQFLYDKVSSDDIDALRFNMFPQTVAVNASEESLESLVISPSALIDLQAEHTSPDSEPKIYKLESSFNYGDRIENILNRLKGDMHELLNIPNLSPAELKGFMTSGKTMQALYWQLASRCEEKFATWRPALEWLCKAVLNMSYEYGFLKVKPPEDLQVNVENVYPLAVDEYEEKNMDLKAVSLGAMSKKSYIGKWNKDFSGERAVEELAQILSENE